MVLITAHKHTETHLVIQIEVLFQEHDFGLHQYVEADGQSLSSALNSPRIIVDSYLTSVFRVDLLEAVYLFGTRGSFCVCWTGPEAVRSGRLLLYNYSNLEIL